MYSLFEISSRATRGVRISLNSLGGHYHRNLLVRTPFDQRYNRRSNSSTFTTPGASSFSKTLLVAGTAFASYCILLNQDSYAKAEEKNTHDVPIEKLPLEDTKSLFSQKSTGELIFALFILKMCSFEILVNLGPKILDIAESLHISAPIYWVIKQTFFRQFCAGETLDESLVQVSDLYSQGLKSILDFSVESSSSPEELDKHTEIIIQTIHAAKDKPEELPFACLKLSGLTEIDLLRKMSDIIIYKRTHSSVVLPWESSKSTNSLPENLRFTSEDFKEYERLEARLTRMGKIAEQGDVRVLIDAEQSWLQPAIDHFANKLSERYNKSYPIIHNTYQMYLKDSLDRLTIDMNESKKKKYIFGVKLVRGAYMDSERKLAVKENHDSPIHDSIQDTHTSYNSGMELLLDNVDKDRSKSKVSVLIATHNQESVERAVHKMKEKGLPMNHQMVFVGQLYGMCDHLSLGAAHEGLNICKYVPFGPVHFVMPYLIRRMQENRGIVARTQVERALLRQEIRRRLIG